MTTPASPAWMNDLTMGVALLGAALGVMNTWNAMSQRRVRLRVRPLFTMTFEGGPQGVSIEVVNLSAFPLTIAEIGFEASGRRKVVLLQAQFSNGSSLPHRLEPRESLSAMFGPRDFGVPNARLGAAYARTACGNVITGNSRAGRQFSKMMMELARGGG